jgi:SSS family solute:Na+ symporter
MFNAATGVTAQTAITALPVFAVLMMPAQAGITAALLMVCVFVLWKTWYQKLPDH